MKREYWTSAQKEGTKFQKLFTFSNSVPNSIIGSARFSLAVFRVRMPSVKVNKSDCTSTQWLQIYDPKNICKNDNIKAETIITCSRSRSDVASTGRYLDLGTFIANDWSKSWITHTNGDINKEKEYCYRETNREWNHIINTENQDTKMPR